MDTNIGELKEDLLLLMADSSVLYVKVNLSATQTMDIKKAFSTMLKKQKEKIKTIPSFIPTPYIKVDELQRYLEVYDYKRKFGYKKYKDIAAAMNYSSGDNTIREMQRFYHKACSIIKNVERGIFPGKY